MDGIEKYPGAPRHNVCILETAIKQTRRYVEYQSFFLFFSGASFLFGFIFPFLSTGTDAGTRRKLKWIAQFPNGTKNWTGPTLKWENERHDE